MNYEPRLKFGAVKNLTDARYAAAVGAAWVGFCFDRNNADYINLLDAKTIFDWITGPEIVAEFGNQTVNEINGVLDILGLQWAQVDNNLSPEQLKEIKASVIKVAHNAEEAGRYAGHAAYILSTDFMMPEYILQVKTNAEQAELVRKKQPYAIEIIGGAETSPGMRDLEPVTEFLEILRED